jgi:hypothetical protein
VGPVLSAFCFLLEPSVNLRTVTRLSITLMLNYFVFANRQSRLTVNPRNVAPAYPYAFIQLPAIVKSTSSKSGSFSYLLRRLGYTPKPVCRPQASLEVAQTRPYSGASHA